jgi:uncharacterized protein with von Willebrand factor type A (vWA) domain
MFFNFFYGLRTHGIKVSLHEYLTLMQALKEEITDYTIDDFYYLCKTVMVKQEAQLDRFDRVFGHYFKGVELIPDDFFTQKIPEDWLRKELRRMLSEEEMEKIEKMGGLDALMEKFRELLAEQRKRHQGGNKWIGTGGASAFGAYGYNPEGFRIGQKENRHNKAIKVWDKREFRNLDDKIELNTRSIKLILKRLRHLTREGLPTELDIDDTIKKTSENAGLLDIQMVASKQNRVKVLLLMDVGGTMDEHVHTCQQLFSAAKHEFKHLEFYYFHNCLYESVWKDNRRRFSERIPTLELINKYNRDYKLIFVGDATMSPYEIFYRGGSVEHYNDEAGIKWLKRMKDHFSNMIWINPTPEYEWNFYETIPMIREFTGNRMFPMSLDGLTQGMKCLRNSKKVYTNNSWDLEDLNEFKL